MPVFVIIYLTKIRKINGLLLNYLLKNKIMITNQQLESLKIYAQIYDGAKVIQYIIDEREKGVSFSDIFDKIYFYGYCPKFRNILEWHKLESTDLAELKELDSLIKVLKTIELVPVFRKFFKSFNPRHEQRKSKKIGVNGSQTRPRKISHGMHRASSA